MASPACAQAPPIPPCHRLAHALSLLFGSCPGTSRLTRKPGLKGQDTSCVFLWDAGLKVEVGRPWRLSRQGASCGEESRWFFEGFIGGQYWWLGSNQSPITLLGQNI